MTETSIPVTAIPMTNNTRHKSALGVLWVISEFFNQYCRCKSWVCGPLTGGHLNCTLETHSASLIKKNLERHLSRSPAFMTGHGWHVIKSEIMTQKCSLNCKYKVEGIHTYKPYIYLHKQFCKQKSSFKLVVMTDSGSFAEKKSKILHC